MADEGTAAPPADAGAASAPAATPDMNEAPVNGDGGSDIQISGEMGMDIRQLHEITLAEDAENDDTGGAKSVSGVDGKSDEPQEFHKEAKGDDGDRVQESDSHVDEDYGDEENISGRESHRGDDRVIGKQDGKDVDLSPDTTFSIKVNGKMEDVTLGEVLKTASAGVHYQRELSQIGRDRKKLEGERDDFYAESKAISAKAEAIMSAEDPYDVAQLIAEMKGEDPDKVFNEMINNTVSAIKRWKEMSPRERAQERELRKYKREELKRNAEKTTHEKTQAATQKRETLTEDLKGFGFEFSDFQNALSEIQELSQNGEELGFGLDDAENIDEDDIIGWMVEKDIWERLESAVEPINPKLLDDEEFTTRARKAIYKVESLHGKMTEAEVTQFINGAIEEETKATSESLSRKAKRRTTSKPAHSREQDDDDGPVNIQEYMDSMRNL